ncbi:type I restriction-modification system subunit M [Phocoenobacter atlanticus]|nr:class I SAM-dependent DNA methyltransferase [Pasteurella atlantica]MDP8101705.1 class I SAM-dependent DNA methyltransferase [Pasteurella atlantica]
MNHTGHNKLVSFIWSIADDCLRDVYVRGKYRDVILPMLVLRRLDALLEATKEDVLEEVRFQQEEIGITDITDMDLSLRDASGYVFYNTSKWTLQKIQDTATNSSSILEGNFNEYLNGFSKNVIEIVDKFNLRSQISHMAKKDVLLNVLEKFTSPYINLTDKEIADPNGNKMSSLTNLGMGYVFEELIRKFNEENNEEAGEHFTPREVIKLMTHLVFEPIKNNLPPVMTIYDPACGSGGMLTESQNFLKDDETGINARGDIYLYGKEINDETYAICKSDMMIKGNNPENIKSGSTLSVNTFANEKFDFMLSNPPYGKSWATEVKYIKDGNEVIDPRFTVTLQDYWGENYEADATPRSSDGQLLFLMEMIDKMKSSSANGVGSRIASVHNGSALFTGDAGGGESNIRRYIIENDLLDAIIQLPNNLFYNTGITTYIWLLSNNKPIHRKGKVQLIDANQLFTKLRKNLGDKNCELKNEHIDYIIEMYQKFITSNENYDGKTLVSKVFDNRDFGYCKVQIERPQRLKSQLSDELIETLLFDKKLEEPMKWCVEHLGQSCYNDISVYKAQIEEYLEKEKIELNVKDKKALLSSKLWEKHHRLFTTAKLLQKTLGVDEFNDFNRFKIKVDKVLKESDIKLTATEKKVILNAVSWYDENAEKVIKKIAKISGDKKQQLLQKLGCKEEQLANFGYYPTAKKDEFIEYETETSLRDNEQIPLTQSIYDYFIQEVQPHVSDAWINLPSVKIGYEISFNKYFYVHKPLRSLEEITQDILALEQKSDGIIKEILGL